MKPPSVSLIIPIYNNADTLVSQLSECEKILNKNCHHWEIIICDDGSTDGTARLLEDKYLNRPGFRLFFHETNQGIAKTVRFLYDQARLDYIVLFSVDGDWNPKDVEKLITMAIGTNADIVIGVRKRTNYTIYRKLISFFYNSLPQLLFGLRTYDAGSIKVFKRSVYRAIPLLSQSVFFEAEFIMKAAKNKAHIVTVPVHYHKRDRTSGVAGRYPYVASAARDMIHLWAKGL